MPTTAARQLQLVSPREPINPNPGPGPEPAPWPATPRPGPYARLCKPVADRLGGAVLTVLSAPVLAVACLAVRVTLGPGVLLRQPRVGKDGTVLSASSFGRYSPQH